MSSKLKLRSLSWALGAYLRSANALRQNAELETIASGVCAAIVENEAYKLAVVGLAEDAPGKPFHIVAAAGDALGYMDGLTLSWDEHRTEGSGPTGQAIRSGKPHITKDSWFDAAYAPWREKGDHYGIRSSVAVPFSNGHRVVGAILVYALHPDAFGHDEVSVFTQLGNDLAFSLDIAQNRERLAMARAAQHEAEIALKASQAEMMRIARISALGEFAASMAHEINQPLAAVATNNDAALRWLAHQPPNIDKAIEAIQRSARDAGRTRDVIRRMRSLVTNQAPSYAEVDVNALILEIVKLTEGEQKRSGVTILADLTEDIPKAKGDQVQCQQVLLNLLLNAMDASRALGPGAGPVEIRSGLTDDNQVLIEIEDHGVGLTPQTAERLFEHFFTTKAGGTGLGLPIARSIIEGHGGRIWASLANPQGAIFSFTLPCAER